MRKHGKENHTREIIEYCQNRESLVSREREIVTSNLIVDSLCMNLKPGGEGGFCSDEHSKKFHEAAAARRKWLKDNDVEWVKQLSDNLSDGVKKSYADGKREKRYFYDWIGKKHKDESKRKIGLTNSIRQAGEKNSQFGTCWITNGELNKKIKCEELSKYLELDWLKGRKRN